MWNHFGYTTGLLEPQAQVKEEYILLPILSPLMTTRHMMEVSELSINLENANCQIEEERLRKENRDWRMEENVRKMEENYAQKMGKMKKMIEDMSQRHK